ncbi:hypothetical protein FRX31_022643 [Thalictrum thalictroides]|uniref:Uncharacterized protein n=1 Tax=Thalictrum thalictroides TaxID=46969 RepID=A0A7J6VSA1_THATH|nr:hypothetical protein FRX31_022643 [Thalictrum thalictroides]
MAHSLTPSPPILTPLLTRAKKQTTLPHLGVQRGSINPQHGLVVQAKAQHLFAKPVDRRTLIGSLIGVAIGLNLSNDNANAAARRAPPPPPTEKKDPNMSALQAKIVASKKRKEAMKAEVERLREKGKSVKVEVIT